MEVEPGFWSVTGIIAVFPGQFQFAVTMSNWVSSHEVWLVVSGVPNATMSYFWCGATNVSYVDDFISVDGCTLLGCTLLLQDSSGAPVEASVVNLTNLLLRISLSNDTTKSFTPNCTAATEYSIVCNQSISYFVVSIMCIVGDVDHGL